MATQSAQDAAAKSRILNHMNADHHDSVIRFLQHYGKVSLLAAYDGKMSDVALGSVTVSCRGQDYRIPLEPAMTSYREARGRVVELDKECRAALGHSDVTVKEYIPPNSPIYVMEFVVILATFLGYSQRWWFGGGGPVARVWPAFARFSWTIQPWLIGFMVMIHGVEALYFARNRLLRHSVSPRSLVFWSWLFSTFIEGAFSFRRFGDHVKAQRSLQKH